MKQSATAELGGEPYAAARGCMVSGLSRTALVDGVARTKGLAVHELSPAGSPGAGSGRDRRWFVPMTARPIPRRHWRSYGTDPLPTPAEALDEPFAAFPSWFLRATCDRCGRLRCRRRLGPRRHAA